MSIFSFFSRKSSSSAARQKNGAGTDEAGGSQPSSLSGARKSQRMEHRELLYSAVRDVMLRAGVLAASYKFKVLSLDARGLQYLVMMDLVNAAKDDMQRLAEIEAMIVQTAKLRHDLLVTAVYWRRTPQELAEGVPPSRATRPTAAAVAKPGARATGYEPLQQAEVEAFKQALATTAKVPPGRLVTSGRRRPQSDTDFEETRLEPLTEPTSSLSGTQYGDLN